MINSAKQSSFCGFLDCIGAMRFALTVIYKCGSGKELQAAREAMTARTLKPFRF
jgi:hypothetical protein